MHIATGIFIRYFSLSFTDAIIVIIPSSMLSADNDIKPNPNAATDIIISGTLNFLSIILITLP